MLIIELSPKAQLAELLGLAGFLGRSTAVIGPLIWGLIAWDPARTPQALYALIGLMALGLWIFRKVPAAKTALA